MEEEEAMLVRTSCCEPLTCLVRPAALKRSEYDTLSGRKFPGDSSPVHAVA